MTHFSSYKLFFLLFLLSVTYSCTVDQQKNKTVPAVVRFASYNVALYRSEASQLAKDLSSGTDSQIQNVAAVIQHVRPDVIGLFEFDYDPSGQMLRSFQDNYLGKSQQGQSPLSYPYAIQIPSNTGIPSRVDYNGDGKVELPNDAFGFGRYEGQYAFALLSKYPIDSAQIRTFQKLLWKQMPNHKTPINTDSSPYYSTAAWDNFRISSKNHADIPIQLPNGQTIHTILAHPTPPVFDGPEDRNGLRNYDEIRLLADYVNNAAYLVDDNGKRGGLNQTESFVIMGDLNADPVDGDSAPGAIQQLLESKRLNPATGMGDMIPASLGGKAHNKAKEDEADPAFDTSFFGKRIDYVLPSADLNVIDAGVFWPGVDESLYETVKDKNASDHLLVWADFKVGE